MKKLFDYLIFKNSFDQEKKSSKKSYRFFRKKKFWFQIKIVSGVFSEVFFIRVFLKIIWWTKIQFPLLTQKNNYLKLINSVSKNNIMHKCEFIVIARPFILYFFIYKIIKTQFLCFAGGRSSWNWKRKVVIGT
jgi:hypothetical protein